MKRKDIIALYQEFRKENQNQKPNRVIVRMHWEDEPEKELVDTIAATIILQSYMESLQKRPN